MSFLRFLRKLWGCVFFWKVEPANREDIEKADIIIGLACGSHPTEPGESNRAMGRVVGGLDYFYKKPMILQREIALCVPSPRGNIWVVSKHRKTGKYLDTWEVLLQAQVICQKNGWKKAIIVAHPDHMWRVVMSARELGFETFPADTHGVPFDKNSPQWWCRSKSLLLIREIPARVFYLLNGWM